MSDINIISINPITRRVSFAFLSYPKEITGLEELTQLSAKTILTTPGKDVFAPAYGGGLLAYVGRHLDVRDIARIRADVSYIVRVSEENILAEQLGKAIAAKSKLRSLTLLGIEVIPEEGALEVYVLVTSELGEEADFSLSTQQQFRRDILKPR